MNLQTSLAWTCQMNLPKRKVWYKNLYRGGKDKKYIYFKLIEIWVFSFCFQGLSGSWSNTADEFPSWVALEPASFMWQSKKAPSKCSLELGCALGSWAGMCTAWCHVPAPERRFLLTETGKQTKVVNHVGTWQLCRFHGSD